MIENRELPKDGNMSVTVITEPNIEPITIDELKIFARIDGTEEDSLLLTFIKAVRTQAELYLGRKLIQQTLRAVMDYWPDRKVQLPYSPLISVSKVATRDEDGTETTFSSDNYYAVTEAIPGYVAIKNAIANPDNGGDRCFGGYIIEYVAGYGDEITDVPAPIINALYLWATDAYENRVVRNEPPPEAKVGLDLFRVERLD